MDSRSVVAVPPNSTVPPLHPGRETASSGAFLRLVHYLLLYRWATLAVPIFLLLTQPAFPGAGGRAVAVLLLALGINGLLSLRRGLLAQMLRQPLFLAADLALMAAFLLLSGGEHSPYILHSFTPVFAAAIGFGVRGGGLAGIAYSLLLGGVAALLWPRSQEPTAPLLLLTYAAGLPLVSVLIGYLTHLWQRTESQAAGLARMGAELAASNRDLTHTNQQLALLRRLTLGLEEAADPEELQEQLLAGLVDGLGFRRAVVALFEPGHRALTGWLSRGGETLRPVSHTASLALGDLSPGTEATPPVLQAMTQQQPLTVTDGRAATGVPGVDAVLALGARYEIFPLSLRGEPVGLLLVDWSNRESLPEADRRGLDLLTHHAGVVLGSLRLCIGRAQNLAVSEERTRIASDIHDTVSQSLFGLAYGLDACTQMLPQQPEPVAAVKAQLGELQPLVFDALQQIRGVVMDNLPGDLTRERFRQTLEKQVSLLTIHQPLTVSFDLSPAFESWPPAFRQQLLLIAYEALANVARHASASHAALTLALAEEEIVLTVEDDGRGFPAGGKYRPGVGLESIRRRVEELGGRLAIGSAEGAGSRLRVRLPQPGG